MKHSLWHVFKTGQEYAAIWPHHAVVAAMTETRVVPAVKFAARWMPPAAVVNLLVQYQWLGMSMAPQALISSLFLLSLPVQGWYWLGKRALTELDPRLKHWYLELAQKLQVQPRTKPKRMDLARLLDKALRDLPPEEH
ncbi:terminus macrodomain insulation protein YfbV [Pseudidiomarina insulisalsae]|nr:terminus macrodomain insulation protein YfbV [Pseudidiomarina insulisalsae]